jgi:Tfp pilus assembly protein PilX
MARLWRLISCERGIATPVAVIVMMVGGLLAAHALASSQRVSGAANEDRRSKRALGAAEAGLQEAAYRLTVLRPNPTHCLGPTGPAYSVLPGTAPAAAGECPPVTGTVAADAAFAYHATPALASGAACADLPNLTADRLSTDHCITSSGTVGGVRRRIQARVRVQRNTIFNIIGLVGLNGVWMINSDKITSDIASNGHIDGDNSVSITGRLKIPVGAPTPTISGSNPPVDWLPDPWTLESVDFAGPAATNNNSVFSSPIYSPAIYVPAERRLTVGNSVTVNLTRGHTYAVCDFWADNSAIFPVVGTSTEPVRIFIDSPDRPGSGCAPGTGRFCLDNSVKFNANNLGSSTAAPLEVYVYGPGNPSTVGRCADGAPRIGSTGTWAFDGTQLAALPATSNVVLNNSVEFQGTIFAPTSRVILTNSIKSYGGIAAAKIDMGNSVEFTHNAVARNQAPAPRNIRRLSWVECRPLPSPSSDPESACA